MNIYSIMNIYREPNIMQIIDFVIDLKFLLKIFVGRNFNICHELFELDIDLALYKAMFIKWVERSELDFIEEPGILIYYIGHTINLIFSNILFVINVIRYNLDNGSDYFIIIIIILSVETM